MDSSKTQAARLSHAQSSKNYQQVSRSAQPFAGESRMEYIPIQKTVVQYQPITKVEYIPREKKVVEYQPVEYQMQYIPHIYYQKIIDYVPVQRMEERIEYVPVQRQIYHPTQTNTYPPYQNIYPISTPSSYAMSSSERQYKPGNPTQSRIQPPKPLHQDMSFQNIRAQYTKQPLPSSKRSKRD